jgi:hypothetical protein
MAKTPIRLGTRPRKRVTRTTGTVRYRSLACDSELSRDEIIGLDGASIGPWPTEYERAFTLRLLNNDIRRSIEAFAYAVLRDKYPALLAERNKRIELIKAAKAARKH